MLESSWKLWPNVNRCFSHPGGGRVQERFKDRRAWQARGWQVQEPQLSVWTREPGWTICIVNIGRKIIHAVIDFVVIRFFSTVCWVFLCWLSITVIIWKEAELEIHVWYDYWSERQKRWKDKLTKNFLDMRKHRTTEECTKKLGLGPNIRKLSLGQSESRSVLEKSWEVKSALTQYLTVSTSTKWRSLADPASFNLFVIAFRVSSRT